MTDKLIFFVDDEPMFINLLEYTFKCRNGYSVETFLNGEDCIEHLYKNPDLVVIDFFLNNDITKLTSVDVVKTIKKNHPATKVIFLSGADDQAVIEEAMSLGVEKYILKDGYFVDTLSECISKLFPTTT